MQTDAGEQMRCPTCQAEQPRSELCRRCRTDLRLLLASEQAYERHRRCCFACLQNGQIEVARRHAHIVHQLRPSGESRRLMALCELLCERWAEAVQLANQVDVQMSNRPV